jgi:DNA/RNA-binding domain of Phe-tRNA-synthetase-like protein
MHVFQQLPASRFNLHALQASVSQSAQTNAGFEEKLALLLEVRTAALDAHLESLRQAVRNMLRNGTFKPTGRSKPASEYLLNAALQQQFPRINPVVDICNYISLKYLIPVSLWDLDKAGSTVFVFRYGAETEAYPFNPSGQILDLQDLACGVAVSGNVQKPCVSPIKDSQATKTTIESVNIGAVLYWPAHWHGIFEPVKVTGEFCALLQDVCSGTASPVEVQFA